MAAETLLISVDPSLCESVVKAGNAAADCRLHVVGEVDQARAILKERQLPLVLFHLSPLADVPAAISLLHEITASEMSTAVVAIADTYQSEQALDLLRAGAVDYLARPLDLSRLAWLLDVLTLRARHEERCSAEKNGSSSVHNLGGDDPFLYCSEAMADIVKKLKSVARMKTTILLTGETGTGKTHLARLIHQQSRQSSKPFVVVNCAALVPTLLESELFGHVKGAFTGADRHRAGKCVSAGEGTLMLDEVNSLPLSLQPKLLRAVDERVFEPVGSDQSQTLRARIIAASNRSLQEEVAGGRFRADLFYRLNVVEFCLPSLRSQRAVVVPLVDHYLSKFSGERGVQLLKISDKALAAFEEYDWPGNVRELKNVVESTVALCEGSEIQVNDLPTTMRHPLHAGTPVETDAEGGRLRHIKEDAEQKMITETLQRNGDNRAKTARELGISRVTLYKKLHKYGFL